VVSERMGQRAKHTIPAWARNNGQKRTTQIGKADCKGVTGSSRRFGYRNLYLRRSRAWERLLVIGHQRILTDGKAGRKMVRTVTTFSGDSIGAKEKEEPA